MAVSSDNIPCARYERPNETNGRVRETLAYASGAAGRPITEDEIISLYDHKGCLEVVWANRAAFDNLAHCIENAWERWGCEVYVTHKVATVVIVAEYGPNGSRVAVS
jgi:hypothetical protein